MGCREAASLGLYIYILWCASSIFRTMIMIVLNMMNNHVKYQFVLGSFGHLRPVTCQASFLPFPLSPTRSPHTLWIHTYSPTYPIRVLSALTRLMFQMLDAVVVSRCCCSMWASIFTASVLRSPPFRLLFLCTVKCFHNRRTATTTTATTMPHDSRILEIHVVLVLPLF